MIGLDAAACGRTGGNPGLGLGIPIKMAESVMQDVVEDGRVIRGWLGASLSGNHAAVPAIH